MTYFTGRQPAKARPRFAGGVGLWLPLAAILGLRLWPVTADLSYLVLAVYALFGRAHLIRALALSWLLTLLNPGLSPEANETVGRYLVIFAAAGSAMIHSSLFTRNVRLHPFTSATILLGFFIIGHSLLFSPMVDVSVLKALSWLLVMAGVISAWCGLPDGQREELSGQLFWGLVILLVVSLPFAVLPAGYTRNGTGFQGILNHPQAFGPAMALLCAWSVARLFGEARPPWWLFGLAGVAFLAILMSEARTAGFAMVLALGLALLIGPPLGNRSLRSMLPGFRSPMVWTMLIAMLLVGLIMAPLLVDTISLYVTKSGRADVGGLLEAYNTSRGILIEPMLLNIAEKPLTGIGFGIASEPWKMIVARDPILGLPVGAAIEKGVTPLMVLEELGVFGAALVALWVFKLLKGSARGGFVPLAVCSTALALNLGEATLFSAGGFGLLPLVLLGWTYSSVGSRKGAARG